MIENIYILFCVIVVLVSFVKPIYAIYAFQIFFLVDIASMFKELESYRLVLAASICLVLGTLIKGYNISQLKFVISTVLLGLIILLSMVLSGHVTEQGMSNLFQFSKVVLFAIITIWFIRKREELITYIKCIVLFSAANGAFAIYEQFFHIAERAVGSTLYRSWGFQQNSNGLAALLVTSVPLAYYIYIHEKNKFQKSINLLSVFLICFGVFFSVSRAGLLGLIFTVACIFAKNIKRIVTFFSIGILLLGFFYFAADLYMERKTVSTTISGKTQYDTSTATRLKLTGTALQLWLKHPVFGIGYQNFIETAKNELGTRLHHVPHDIFVSLLCETGLPGLFLFIYILIQSYRVIVSLKHRGDFYGELVGYFQISIFGWVLFLFFSTSLNNAMLWIVLTLPFILENIFQIEQLSIKKSA